MSMGTGVQKHHQLKDFVYLQLRQEIVSMQLPPGYALREAEFAARFGVSKTPLREAFVRLQKDGFVEVVPYKGAVVSGYGHDDLREIYEVRELLEGACARHAAASMAGDELARLHRVVRDSETLLAADDTDALSQLFDEFDAIVYAHASNGRIGQMLDNIRDHVTRIGQLTIGIPGRLDQSVEQHAGIYDAIVRRDGNLAEQRMREHILSVMGDQLAQLEVEDEQPHGTLRRQGQTP
jgi:DNA-binding GntR family transcriptional regulator